MRTKSLIAAGALALLAVGIFAGVSLAGGNGPSHERTKVLKPVTAVATPPAGAASRVAAKPKHHASKPTIQYFFASKRTIPAEGSGVVTALRCPKSAGEPIGGGAGTQQGIVISYLSRVNPQTGKAPARTYYVGVDDNSDDPAQDGAGAFVEIQCAKNITVKHP